MSAARLVRAVVVPYAVLALSACASSGTPARSAASAEGADASLDARLLQMLDTRRSDSALIDRVLADNASATRARGALAIGQIRLKARFGVLRQLLVDADTAVAANAAYALGVGKDSGAVAALARAVAGAPDAIAKEAAWSLGELGEPSRAVLALALGDGSAQPWSRGALASRSATVQAAVVLAAVKLRPVPVASVTPWLLSPSPEVVRSAAYVIGRQRLAGGVRALLSVANHKDAETRSYIARGLAKNAAGDSLATRARDALARLLRDDDAHVRVNAAISLSTYGSVVAREIERALTDDDINVRVAASDSLASVFGRDSLVWRRVWNQQTHYRVQQLMLSAARAAGYAGFRDEEREWSAHPDWRYRRAALEARATDGKADRLAIAREFVGDRDPRVRAAAVALLSPAVSERDARALVMPLLADPLEQIRASALSVIARRARAEDVSIALDGLRRASKDAEGDARQAALRLLASAWTRDSARIGASTREELAAWSQPGSAAERRLVANVTPLAAWSRAAAPPTTRPLSDYQRLVAQWVQPGARQPRAIIRTDHGTITLELFAREAPLIVESFVKLSQSGFYRASYFHRVVPNFVAQDGDPRGDGSGGPGYQLRESFSRQRHDRGALGLATSGPDTGGSQYYLCLSPQPHLDGAYTVFGRVISGETAMDDLVQGDRMLSITIR